MLSHPLILPIHISALPVLKAGTKFSALQVSLANLEAWNAVSSRPKESAYVKVDAPAILLHWVLPAAFKLGLQQEDGLTFPAVPNRWLVVRTHREGTEVVVKKWIIESDYYVAGGKKSELNYLLETQDGLQMVRLGRKLELPAGMTYKEALRTNYLPDPITAVPGWDPAFAAKFWSAENVFAMRDTFEGATLPVLSQLSYQVFGWYAEPVHDLLSQRLFSAGVSKASPEGLGNVLSHMGWDHAADGGDAPEGILCHGMLQGIDTSGKTASRKPTQTQVYVANSAAEAAGKYLSRQKIMEGRWADLLDQYQYALIQEQGWPFDPKEFLRQRQHDKGFQSVGGSHHFEIQVRNKDSEATGTTANTQTQTVAFDFPAAITELLDDLNRAQAEMEQHQATRQSLANDLFARMQIHNLPEEEQPDGNAAMRFPLDTDQLTRATKACEVAHLTVTKFAALLEQALDNLSKEATCVAVLTLVNVAGQRFWKPNEPTVLITGLSPNEAYAHSGRVGGRNLAQVATSIASGGSMIPLPTSSELGDLGSRMPEQAIQVLWKESKLYNPAYFPALASYTAQQTGARAEDVLRNLEAALNTWASKPTDSQAADGTSSPHRFEYMRWQMPWVPMYMDWEITFKFFANQGSKTPIPEGTDNFRGRCLLSAALLPQMAQIAQMLGLPPSEDAPLFQELSGLSDQFLARLDGLQLPIFDLSSPPSGARSYKRRADELADLVGLEHPWGPLMEPGIYSLAREGGYLFKGISVLDAFGQEVIVSPPRADEVIPAPRVDADANQAYFQMPFRLNFGARLQLDWVDAGHQEQPRRSNSDPATSPIYGWLVHQHERQCLAVFDGHGAAMGELSILDGKVAWQAEPKTKPMSAALKAWLQTMVAHAPKRLKELMAAIQSYTEYARRPSNKQSRRENSWLPTGLPLALTRLHCRLEQQEPLMYNYRFDGKPSHIDLGELSFNFSPGNDRDGVLFYTQDPAWGWMQSGKSFLQSPAAGPMNLSLKFASKRNEALLHLLIDPQLPVEIRSVILPTQTAQLQESYVKRGLSSMEHRVHVSPLLTPAAVVRAPLPDLPGTRWEWTTTDLDGATSVGEVEIAKMGKAQFEPLIAQDIQFKIIQETSS